MKDKKFIEGFLLGFAITSIIWAIGIGFIIAKLTQKNNNYDTDSGRIFS